MERLFWEQRLMAFPGSLPEIAAPNSNDIKQYLRSRRLPRTNINIAAATNAIRQQRIVEALPKGREISFTSSDAARQIVFGQCKVPGIVVFAAMESDNSHLHLVIAVAGHEVEDIYQISLEGSRVDFASIPGASTAIIPKVGSPVYTDAVYLEKRFGTDNQAAQTYITSKLLGWTGTHVLYGVANAGVSLRWDPLLYADGFPEISFIVKGMKCYDPRTTTTYYTANAALCTAAFIMNSRYGLGYSQSQIDMQSLEDAADICDEVVSGEYRYTVNGYFLSSETQETILQNLVESMQGRILFNYTGRQWQFKPAKYYTPSLTITLDDILSDIGITTQDDRSESFNAVQGKYINPNDDYSEWDFPIVKNNVYATEDGGQKLVDVRYPLVTSPVTAQRLSKIKLERSRQGITVSFTARLKYIQLTPGDNCYLTISKYGWSAKVFEVIEVEILENGTAPNNVLVVALILRENASGVYDWNDGEETRIDLAANTNLPSPFHVPGIIGLKAESGTNHLYINGDGTVYSRIFVEFDAITDSFVNSGGKIEWQYQGVDDTAWTQGGELIGDLNSFYINNVRDGIGYNIRVRAVNAVRAQGAWSTVLNHVVIGKTAPPSDVASLYAAITDYGVTFSWPKISDLDLGFYEIREGASWAAGVLVDRIKANTYSIGLKTAGSYTFYIKALDTSGNYSTNAVSQTIVITAPSITAFSGTVTGEEIYLNWAGAKGSYAIDSYSLYYGDSFGSATLIASLKSTSFKQKVEWGGNRTFWVEVEDVNGNASTAISFNVLILTPDRIMSLVGEVVDNNVLLKWTETNSATLPIKYYNIYKGDVETSLTLIGTQSGTFAALFETIAGTYTYWVSAVDSAGTEGLKRSTTEVVDEPPDFILRLSQELDPDLADTFDNMIVEGEFLRPQGAGFSDAFDLIFG